MSLKLTTGYRFDLTQIARILQYSVEHSGELEARSQIADALGLSVARFSRLWMMGGATGLLKQRRWSATDLGTLVEEYDVFLDNIGTLWLLHYVLSSNPETIVWNVVTNWVIPENRGITTEIAKPYFVEVMQEFSQQSYDKYLGKEIRSFIDAYTEQGFRHLRYLRTEGEQIYVLGDRQPVPPHIFLAAVLLYRQRHAPGVATLDVSTLASAPNSPGRVFAVTERQVRDLLEQVEGTGSIYVETRADLDQVRFRNDLDFLGAVRRYYEGR